MAAISVAEVGARAQLGSSAALVIFYGTFSPPSMLRRAL